MTKKVRNIPVWAWILIIIALITVVPTVFGILVGLAGTAFGLVVAWFSIIVAFGAASFSLVVTAIVLTVVSIMCIPADAIVGVLLLGISMLIACVGVLFFMLTVFLGGTVTPMILKGIKAFFQACWKGIMTVWQKIN